MRTLIISILCALSPFLLHGQAGHRIRATVGFTNSLSTGGGGGGGFTTNIWVTSLSGGANGTSASDTNGYKFTVGASDIVVTDLGTYFTAGTYADTSVELLNSSCTRLAIATVPVAGASSGAFNYAPTLGTAVTLTAGATYHIRRNSSGFNEYLYGATPTVTAVASVVSGTFNDCSDPGYTVACNFKYYVP